MRKLITMLSVLVFMALVFGMPKKTTAALRQSMCDAVSLEPIINKTHTLPPITNNPSTNPIIYVDDLDKTSLYFMENDTYVKAETGEAYGNVQANLVIDRSKIASVFPDGNIPADFQVVVTGSSGCGWTTKKIGDFPPDGRIKDALAGPDHWYCEEGFLKSFDHSSHQVELVLGSEKIQCPSIVFNKGLKPSVACDITVDKPQGYTIDDDVVITGISNIQAQCMNLQPIDYMMDYYAVVSCSTNMTVNGSSRTCTPGGLQDNWVGTNWASLKADGRNGGYSCSTHEAGPFNLGKLASGSYTIQATRVLKYRLIDPSHDKIYCSKTISVVLPGETLTPEATNSGDVGISTVSVNMASAAALCESIPTSSMCGGVSCKQKCENCSKPAADGSVGGIWTALGCLPTNITELVNKLFTYFSGILGGFIFICIIWNGIKVMLSRGAPDALKKAQEAITSCIIGLLVLVFSVLFLQVVGVDILKIPGWTKTATTVQTTP